MGQFIAPVKKFLDSLGKPIGEGRDHKVYANPNNTYSVIKTGNRVLEHAEIFKKYPDYFPKVYEIVNCGSVEENYIVIEKLNVNTYMLELVDMYVKIQPIYRSMHIKRPYTHNYINYDTYRYVRPVYTRIITMNRIREIIKNTNLRDVDHNNFGYDKYGKIKGLDL